MARDFDWNKPFRCKNGKPARLIGDVDSPAYPKAVAVRFGNAEQLHSYTAEGFYYADNTESVYDLVNIETVKVPECWLVCWPRYGSYEVYVIAGGYETAIEKGAVLVHHQPASEIEV